MHAIDPAARARLQPLLQRVLIYDPNLHAASLLEGALRGFGARDVRIEVHTDSARSAAEMTNPTLVFTEAAADADPFVLVNAIRRSTMACRQTPIFVLTTLATASALGLAQDAGAHEFLRKPFTPRDVLRRLDHLARHPRAWVEKPGYVGPERRLFNSGAARRRLSDRQALIEQGVSASRLYLAR